MRRLRPLLPAAMYLAAFALIGWVLGRDLWRWRTGQPHLSAVADAGLLVFAAGALAFASTLFVRAWARMLAR